MDEGGAMRPRPSFDWNNPERVELRISIVLLCLIDTAELRVGAGEDARRETRTCVVAIRVANNQIPSGLINATAKAVLSYLPLPNRTSPVGVLWGQQNYVWQQEADFPYDNVVGRLDRNFGAKDRTYIRFAA
jgi:hypothetical protein